MSQEVVGSSIPVNGPGFPARGILAFTKLERHIFKSLKPGGEEVAPILGGLTRVTVWKDLVLAGPVLGAPQAAMVLEILSRRGVREFLSLGWCGSLTPELKWGDIIMPLLALSEEGTSAHYRCPEGAMGPDPALAQRLAGSLTELDFRFTSGKVWTTDAPYRETRDKVRNHTLAGCLAVDMETSAVISVCRFRKLSWAGLMVVSDELWGEKWRPGFKSAELKSGLTHAATAILRTAAVLTAATAGSDS
jgi:uridine phosphorylase